MAISMSEQSSTKNKSNAGIIVFRPAATSQMEEKTIVITGPSRSGTTMVAQIVKTLGIHLGDAVDVNLLEDIEIRNATKAGDIEAMDRIIGQRNNSHSIWGWKYPGSLELLADFAQKLRNPHFIFTFRDPIATTVRNQIHEEDPINLIDTVEDALNYMKLATQWIRDHAHPVIGVSYEKALLNPSVLVQTTAEFLGVKITEAQEFEAVQQVQLGNTRYLSSNLWESNLGFIDSIEGGKLNGWAYLKDSEQPATLEIRINLKKVAEITAETYREDLEQNGMGNGHCGFSVDINPYLQRNITNRIEVVFVDSEYPLQGSPKFL